MFMRIKVSLVAFLFTLISGPLFGQNVEEGKKLFEQNCTSCHAVHSEVVGPALKDVHKRRDEAWLLKWIKNPQAVIKSGDEYANALYKKYNQEMTAFGSLGDAKIKDILAYIKDESGKAPVVAKGPENGDGGKSENGAGNGGSMYSGTTLIILLALVIILVLVVIVLSRVNAVLKETLFTQRPDVKAAYTPEEEPKKIWADIIQPWIKGWNTTVATLAILTILGLFGAVKGYYYSIEKVGVQQNYQPTQPIAFSHKIHAGDYKINCQYCHSSAEKSKQASIPSASTCMNCHAYVQAKEKYNGQISPEIQKIYKAIGYNPETKSYEGPQTPIKWVRIHNLPDLAYFNHSQHVKVGKIACQKCHGEIQTMTEVKQQNTLQMGWCVDCHRNTNVNLDNKYYEQLHKNLKEKGDTTIKVAENGGLECSKCHY